jgi:hypothetical protein
LFVLASFGLFVMDVGSIFRQKRIAQTAADAAALAGAYEVFRASASDSVQANAHRAAVANGFTNGSNSVVVTVANPPTTSYYYNGKSAFVEANISQTYPTTGLRFFGINSVPIRAHAVAGGGGTAINCVTVLDPSGSSVTMDVGSLSATCGMVVNSSSGAAINMPKNNSDITITGGGRVSVTGGFSGNGTISPSLSVSVPPASDPLVSLPPPTFANSCTKINATYNNDATITPGVYCNGIDIEKGTITFASQDATTPGIYVLCGVANDGASFYTKGGNVAIQDDGRAGVLLVFTKCVVGGTTYDYATPISMKASSDLNLKGPISGPYAGIAMYQDRNAPTNLPQSDWHGSSTSSVDGLIYFPQTGIHIKNGQGTLRASALVTRSMFQDGNSKIFITNSYTSAPPPLKRVTLVE